MIPNGVSYFTKLLNTEYVMKKKGKNKKKHMFKIGLSDAVAVFVV